MKKRLTLNTVAEALRAFTPSLAALRAAEGGRRQRGGAALAREGSGHPPEALCAFPLLSNRYAIREGGHPQRGGAALARGCWYGAAFALRPGSFFCH